MGLFTPEFGLVFWMLVVFLIVFAILAKFGWPAIVKSLEDRASFIEKGVTYSQEAKSQLDHAQEQAQQLLADAQKQQIEIVREASTLKAKIIDEAKQAASVEAKKVIDDARLSMEQARKESELQFRREVSRYALEIAEKLTRKELSNDKSQIEMIDKLLNDIENKN